MKLMVDNLKQLTSVLKGLIDFGAISIVGFFIYAIHQVILDDR